MSVNLKGTTKGYNAGFAFVQIKADLGGTFTNVATELAKYAVDSTPWFGVVEETNVTGAGKRLYVRANGATSYVALT